MSPVKLASLVAVALWISGCHSRNESAPAGPASAPSVTAGTPITTGGKPTSPIGLGYEFLGEPRIGEALDIRITSRSSFPMSNLTIDVRGDQELMVSPDSLQFFSAQVAAGEPMVHVVTVTPLFEGSHLLSVTAQATINGQVQADYVTISIRVGDVSLETEPMGTLETDDAGETIISLPADDN